MRRASDAFLNEMLTWRELSLNFCAFGRWLRDLPIRAISAHAFALKYYDFLFGRADAVFDGKPVRGSLAGALLATRRYFMETHRNPLGLAYILYASEHTRLLGTRSSV